MIASIEHQRTKTRRSDVLFLILTLTPWVVLFWVLWPRR